MLTVVIYWPHDQDRGFEQYGPFKSEMDRTQWVADCQTAANLGWTLLQGAMYVLDKMSEPFDPTSLMQEPMVSNVDPRQIAAAKAASRVIGCAPSDIYTYGENGCDLIDVRYHMKKPDERTFRYENGVLTEDTGK